MTEFKHDSSNDQTIVDQIDDPAHGDWSSDGKHQIYTPKPSFFAKVHPHDLVTFFMQNGGDDARVRLP